MSHSTAFLPLIDRCWVLTGPTAAGKSNLAIQLASTINAEIVSMDSMAVYQQMDIGTAKPSPEQQQIIQHHAIDLVPPDQRFSVAQYLQAAHQAASEIHSRGKEVLFVGGTPMYLKGILRGFDPGPPADWQFRQQVADDVRRYGLEALRERLWQVDPLTAFRLHPNDMRRMTRALEVAWATGQPLSHRQMQLEQRHAAENCKVFWCQWPRQALHRRIDQRVTDMFTNGLVAETQALLDRYQTLSPTAVKAVGYAEVIEHLQQRIPLSDTITAVQTRTRQLARRQETFLRGLGELRSIPMTELAHVRQQCDFVLRLVDGK